MRKIVADRSGEGSWLAVFSQLEGEGAALERPRQRSCSCTRTGEIERSADGLAGLDQSPVSSTRASNELLRGNKKSPITSHAGGLGRAAATCGENG